MADEEVSFEEDVQIILDKHDDRINSLETKVEVMDMRLKGMEGQINDVKNNMIRFENNSYQNSSAILQTMSQLVINTSTNATQLATNSNNNRTQIVLKVLGGLGLFIAGVIFWKYGIKLI